MSLDKAAEQKHGEMRGTFKRTVERKPLFPDFPTSNELWEKVGELKTRIQALEAYKADIKNAVKTALDEKCTLDQKHCACVPLLRARVKELKTENKELRKMLLAGSPPYYEKWQEVQVENKSLRERLETRREPK